MITEPDQREPRLHALAERAAGMRYDDPATQAILDSDPDYDWAQYYPVVGLDGLLTGDICGSDEDGFANVDDLAAIRIDDLTPTQVREVDETGYSPVP